MTDGTLFNTGLISTATLSPCHRYRYTLGRQWDESLPTLCWIMLNPSTADAEQDDPTIRRCCGFARDWGHGGIIVVNLFAFRSTEPSALYQQDDANDIVGPDNDSAILHAVQGRRIMAAWGVNGSLDSRDREVMKLLAGKTVECLGMTSGGHPRHPLYVPGNVKPATFEMRDTR